MRDILETCLRLISRIKDTEIAATTGRSEGAICMAGFRTL